MKNISQVELEFKIGEKDFDVASKAVSETKSALLGLGLNGEIIRKAMVIILEAVSNVIIHARFGTLKVFTNSQRILIVVEDIGKGIPDIDLALQEGYTTAPDEIKKLGFGSGFGLPNIRQCADKLTIRSRIEVGVELKALVFIDKNNSQATSPEVRQKIGNNLKKEDIEDTEVDYAICKK